MDISSTELTSPERTIPIEITVATPGDIDGLARVQWFARKQGVELGYLPERVLGLHPGEPSSIANELGVQYAAGELTRHYMMNPKEDDVILAARVDHEIVGKGSIQVDEATKTVEFDKLEVLPNFQGKGIAMKLRNESVAYVRKNFPRVKTVRFGRYNISTQYSQSHYAPDSFFNILLEKTESTSLEEIDNKTSITWLDIPIDTYEEEVKKRLR